MTPSTAPVCGVRPASTRELQLRELEVLDEVARLCEVASLRWFVLGGTLLGAARHGGFIPWDDDIDVGMPRPDYQRLDEALRRQAPAGYAWESPATSTSYPFVYGKLIRRADDVADPAVDHLGVQRGVFIDIFPLDGAPASRRARMLHAALVKLAVTVTGARLRRRGRRRILALPLRVVPRAAARALLDRLVARYPFESSGHVVNMGGAWGYRRECQPRDRLLPASTLPFEGRLVPVPGAWEAYLAAIYGDYRVLPPAAERVPRHALTGRHACGDGDTGR